MGDPYAETVLTPSADRRRFVGLLADGVRGAGCDLTCGTQGRRLLLRTSQLTAHGPWRMLHDAQCKVQCLPAPEHVVVEPRRRPPTAACQQTA